MSDCSQDKSVSAYIVAAGVGAVVVICGAAQEARGSASGFGLQ